MPTPIPRKLAISRKLLKKPTYRTLAGIQRISSNSTKRRVALVRNSRSGAPESGLTGGSDWRGEGRRGSMAPQPSICLWPSVAARRSHEGDPEVVRAGRRCLRNHRRDVRCILGVVTPSATSSEPACPASIETGRSTAHSAPLGLRVERRAIADIPRATWDAVASRTPWATPFSGWAFQRAWWDAYGANGHEDTLVVLPEGAPTEADPVAIVPLMHRHEVEPQDVLTHTLMRHGADVELTPVPGSATAVFFGASYHADYATILAAPGDLPAVADAIVADLADSPALRRWDVVDLRRLRCGDPAADALAAAFGAREIAEGWSLNVEREDVCPVVTLPTGADMDGYLATLE